MKSTSSLCPVLPRLDVAAKTGVGRFGGWVVGGWVSGDLAEWVSRIGVGGVEGSGRL